MFIYATVATDLEFRGLDTLFYYKIPTSLQEKISVGTLVTIPFGKSFRKGIVTALYENDDTVPKDITIKYISSISSSATKWLEQGIKIAVWMHDYYGCPYTDSLLTVLPFYFSKSIKNEKKQMTLKLICFDFDLISEKLKRSEKQREIIEVLKNAPHNEVLRDPVMDINSLRALEKKGFIQICYGTEYRPPSELKRDIDETDIDIKLTEQQQNALDKIKSLIDLEKPNGVLLQGVTGSGKTQVYINCIKYVLSKGRNAIILVPELSLTAQFADIYRREFGNLMAFIHSAMSLSEKSDELRRIANGEARVVLGARSAIFSPLENVGLIIIDEEHDQAYKQESSPKYHARHIAIKRSLFDNSVIVFGSATPSLESYVRAYNGNYSLVSMTSRASGNFPTVKIIDMRMPYNRIKDSMFTVPLVRKISQVLESKHQVILLINRRGFFNYLFCSDCGYVFSCPSCDISLRFHQSPPRLLCHYCDHEEEVPDVCPECGGLNITSFGGGTQRTEEEIKNFFPNARVLRLDRDIASHKNSASEIYDKFKNCEADILVGTQMASKGFDFSNVELVAVMFADFSFSMPDFRACEKSWQLFMQSAGRAGRHLSRSYFYLQTYNPCNPSVMAINGRAEDFFKSELIERKEFSYPPFMHLIRIVFSNENSELCEKIANDFSTFFNFEDEIKLGPSQCPIFKIKDLYRFQLYIKTKNVLSSVSKYRDVLSKLDCKNVNISIDVDSYSFL